MHLSEAVAVFVFVLVLAAVYLGELGLLLRHVLHRRRHRPGPSGILSKKALVLHALAVGGILCFLYGYFIEPYRVEVTHVIVRTDKLKHASLRIVQISDTHCDNVARTEPKLASLINPLQPDLIVFTGDALDAAVGRARFQETLRGLHASLGKFAVRGNMDDDRFGTTPLFAHTGFRELAADSVTLTKNGETIRLVGISVFERAGFRGILAAPAPSPFTIFLFHYPDLIEFLQGLNVDLYLAGHTHGGQVRLPFYGALMTLARFGKKYEAGRYEVGGTTLYVNRGLGMEGALGPRVRFLCRPEITVIDVVPASLTSSPPL